MDSFDEINAKFNQYYKELTEASDKEVDPVSLCFRMFLRGRSIGHREMEPSGPSEPLVINMQSRPRNEDLRSCKFKEVKNAPENPLS